MAQLIFEGLALADIEEETDGAYDLARLVSSRRRRDNDLDRRAVLSQALRLFVEGLAGEERVEVTSCLLARGEGIRLADRLFRPPAEELLGAGIPERDEAISPDGDDC